VGISSGAMGQSSRKLATLVSGGTKWSLRPRKKKTGIFRPDVKTWCLRATLDVQPFAEEGGQT
jgi:hypothetical protein